MGSVIPILWKNLHRTRFDDDNHEDDVQDNFDDASDSGKDDDEVDDDEAVSVRSRGILVGVAVGSLSSFPCRPTKNCNPEAILSSIEPMDGSLRRLKPVTEEIKDRVQSTRYLFLADQHESIVE